VVETDVHYPTDINLLYDAMRKVIQLTADYADSTGIIGWRQSQYNIRQVKKAYRNAQQKKRSTSRDEAKKSQRDELIAQAHRDYIDIALPFIVKSQATLAVVVQNLSLTDIALVLQIESFIRHAHRQIDQIERRVLQGQKIPHEEKVFSLFQPHTEWISKGKAGVAVELGLKVCIVEDSQGYILHHRVMQQETDNQIAIEMIKEAKRKYPTLTACSFDKGFHTPENQLELAALLDQVVLPKKGRCNKKEQEKESSPDFRSSKRKHSAVESGINALEVHGLDKCLDHGLEAFKRYVGLAVVARNIQKMGAELISEERRQEERKKERERKRA
jgi:transposase, IS5 family